MSMVSTARSQYIRIVVIILACLFVVWIRFYHITENDFMFYDEGLYLNHNRAILELIQDNYPKNFKEFQGVASLWFRSSLTMTKVLWVLISDVRVFWGGLSSWFFPRLISAIAGCLTLWVTFLFARRYFSSQTTGYLSLIFLALLPSHIFYSRLALQEAFATLLVTCGFYFYLCPRKFHWKTYLSGICFAGAFLTNYRLIIIPALVLFCEIYTSLSFKKRINIRKYIWNTLTFFGIIIWFGNLDQGQNAQAVFTWMFRQTQLVKTSFDIFNLLSYPYLIFRLEGMIFGILFFGNIYYLLRKQWVRSFPFLLAFLVMIIFSLASDRAARYLCVILPFMAIAAASLAVYIFEKAKQKDIKIAVVVCVFLTVIVFGLKSFIIAQFKSDYASSVRYLELKDPAGKICSTQYLVQNLFTDQQKMEKCPLRFSQLLMFKRLGFRYLIIDPQAYISWTQNNEKFNPQLIGYLQFITTQIKPIKTFSHFNQAMLERFVFEHNESLRESIVFLRTPQNNYGQLRIYDIGEVIQTVRQNIASRRPQ